MLTSFPYASYWWVSKWEWQEKSTITDQRAPTALWGRGTIHARIQRRGTGDLDPPPLKNHKSIGFLRLSNTGPDLLKNHKATNKHSMFGHHRPASKMPFKMAFCWQAYYGSLLVFGSSLPSSKKRCHSSTPLTNLSGSVHTIDTHMTARILIVYCTSNM